MKRIFTHITLLLIVMAVCSPNAIMAQKKGKKPTKVVAQPKEDYSKYTDNPICKVTIVDSLTVPVYDVLKNIPLPKHLGRFIPSSEIGGLMVYENEFKDMRMYSTADASGHHRIYRQTLMGTKWGDPEQVSINGTFIDLINPFPMPDGQTLFFAARSEEDNDGKTFSLYMTTYDSETHAYLTPTRLPYPFVSDANDLYYIEDETNLIAWLVTTRRQAEGNACIYTMQNKQPWEYYDTEELEPSTLKSYAIIERISDTWASDEERNTILTTLKELRANSGTNPNDNDGSAQTTRKNLQTKIENTSRQLDEYRRMYHSASPDAKRQLEQTIKETEQLLQELYKSYRKL